MQTNGQLDFVRIGTRLPIVNPNVIKDWHYEAISQIQAPHLMVHVNHPAELTPESLAILSRLRKESDAILMSQSVLLRGVNDNPEILIDLFTKLAKNGIRPYYLYQNDQVPWAQHFTVPIDDAIALCVIDTPDGYGKIPIPEGGAWEVDYSNFTDFQGKKHTIP
jgi:lysine 2,3-aminomutase